MNNNNRNTNYKPFSFNSKQSNYRFLDDVQEMTPQGNYSIKGIEPLPFIKTGRRDNTIIIKDNYVEDYRKKEVPASVFRGTRREGFNTSLDAEIDAGLASGVKGLVSNNNRARASTNVGRFKNNDYDEDTMYLRPESYDGKPLTDLVRIRQLTQQELRAKNENSQRADIDGQAIEAGQQNRGIGQDPNNMFITKNPTQNREFTDEDRILGRGHTTGPEHRPIVQESNSARSNEENYIGPGKFTEGGEIYLSENIKNRELFSNNHENENNYMGPATNSFRSLVKHGLTQFNTSRVNTSQAYVGAPLSKQGVIYRNNQEARGVDTSNEQNYTGHGQSTHSGYTFENNQPANPTGRENENEYVGHGQSVQSGFAYENYQPANPTGRETDFIHLGAGNDTSRGYVYQNGQQANTTIRENIGETNYIGHGQTTHGGFVKENYQPANPTTRDNENEYIGHGQSTQTGYVYENYQPANPTGRENDVIHLGAGTDTSRGYTYQNGQLANETNRQNTSVSYNGVAMNSKSTYLAQPDETRAPMVEDVLAKDYKGVSSTIKTTQSRDFFKTFTSDDRRELVTNIKDREVNGLNKPLNVGANDYGKTSSNMLRETESAVIIPQAQVSNSYKIFDYNVRNKDRLNKRINIDKGLIETVNNGNPYVNNLIHRGYANNDVIRETTLLSDRIISN